MLLHLCAKVLSNAANTFLAYPSLYPVIVNQVDLTL